MCPPGTDQTTRGGQERWSLLAPSLKQKQKLFTTTGNKSSLEWSMFLESVTPGLELNLFSKLARPGKSGCNALSTSRKTNVAATSGVAAATAVIILSASRLEALPAEILALVLTSGRLSMRDQLNLGRSSQTLWMHVWRHIREDCRRRAAPWAGTSLIATGNWLQDLPQRLYDLFPEIQKRDRLWERGQIRRLGMCPARQWNADARGEYEDVEGKDRGREWLGAGKEGGLSMGLVESLEEAVEIRRGRGEKWMLRNLSMMEFVRLEIIEGDEQSEGEGVQGVVIAGKESLSLDEILLMKICWTEPFIDISDEDDETTSITRGDWAGHRFDVVPEEDGGAVVEGWRDVTDEICSLASMG